MKLTLKISTVHRGREWGRAGWGGDEGRGRVCAWMKRRRLWILVLHPGSLHGSDGRLLLWHGKAKWSLHVIPYKALCKASSHNQELKWTTCTAPCDLHILGSEQGMGKRPFASLLTAKQRFLSLAFSSSKCPLLSGPIHIEQSWSLLDKQTIATPTNCMQEAFFIW